MGLWAPGVRPVSDAEHAGSMFAEPLAKWLGLHSALIDALVRLRLADETEAVDALLELSELAQLRLSWKFWASLCESWDLAPDDILRDWLPGAVVEHCELAIWGRPLPDDRDQLLLCESW